MLSPDAERALALLGDNLWAEIDLNEMPSAHEDAFGALLADIPWPKVKDDQGKEVQLTLSNYGRFRPRQTARCAQGAVTAFLGTLRQYQHAFAATLAGQFELDVAYARARGYDTALAAYLDKDDIATAVHDNLIATVNANLPLLHRYVELRKRVLGLPEVHLYDLYMPLSAGVETRHPLRPGAADDPRAGSKPLGAEYGKVLAEGLDPANGWLDLYPHRDKESGAFSSSVYGPPPVRDDELPGLARRHVDPGPRVRPRPAQPPGDEGPALPQLPLRDVPGRDRLDLQRGAAVATTWWRAPATPAEKAYLLVGRLEDIRTTIFRQTMFAEFERTVHGFVEAGTPVTATLLEQTYRDLVRRYYGPGFTVDPNDGMEWAYIPHFYYKYYVYSYATGLSSGIAIADRVREQGEPAVGRLPGDARGRLLGAAAGAARRRRRRPDEAGRHRGRHEDLRGDARRGREAAALKLSQGRTPMNAGRIAVLTLLAPTLLVGCGSPESPVQPAPPALDYHFEEGISREVLLNYLSRALTTSELCLGFRCPGFAWEQNLRLIAELQPKFLGRAAYVWGWEDEYLDHLQDLPGRIEVIHAIDPDIVVQGCVFEIVTADVERVQIEARVQEALGLDPVARHFDLEAMGSQPLAWHTAAVLPDITRTETQLWFLQLAMTYIDGGVEAIHFGQLGIVAKHDQDLVATAAFLEVVRAYARVAARRGWVLLDAHTHGLVRDGRLLLDFHSWPLRPREVGAPGERDVILQPGFLDAIYGRSRGGVTPSGWYTQSLPYLVELDNGYAGAVPGVCDLPECVWGDDEITWFANLSPARRDAALRRLHADVRALDPHGRLQLPAMRPIILAEASQCPFYFVHDPRDLPEGYGQEDVVRELWGIGARRDTPPDAPWRASVR